MVKKYRPARSSRRVISQSEIRFVARPQSMYSAGKSASVNIRKNKKRNRRPLVRAIKITLAISNGISITGSNTREISHAERLDQPLFFFMPSLHLNKKRGPDPPLHFQGPPKQINVRR